MDVLRDADQTLPQTAEACSPSDWELTAEVLRRDRKATAEFVDRFADHVYGYIRRRLVPRSDLVDDVVQEVFLAAWESLDKFRGDSSLDSWLLGIARHKVEDYYRKCLREVQPTDPEEGSGWEGATVVDGEEVLERRMAEGEVAEILASLPEAYSFVLLWRYWERRSLREIAEHTGRSEKGVERLLARARDQFRKKWNER